MRHTLLAKSASISVIRFGLEYSLEARRGARPAKRFFRHPNNTRFDDKLLFEHARVAFATMQKENAHVENL